MLRTLWKNVKGLAHKNVRFLPASILVLAFLILLLFNPNIAEASWYGDIGSSLLSVIGSALGWILKIIFWTTFQLTGLIFSASGTIFDTSVKYSLSGSLYSSFTFINNSWAIIRNLINSIFIFAVLYVALKQLFSFSASEIPKKALTNIIIAALLINFSLFFTKAIIDASNFTSRALYYTMSNNPTDGSAKSYGPANALKNGLAIEALLKDDSDNFDYGDTKAEDSKGIDDSTTQLNRALLYLGGTLIHIVCSIIFFTMAFFFLARIIVLIIVMITSPVYFLSFIINDGSIKKIQAQWKDALIGQAVFPIIFMLIIYVAVSIVNNGLFTGADASANFKDGMSGGVNGFSLIINFAIVIGLMIFALTKSKEYAGKAGSMGSKFAGTAGAGAFSSMAFAGRQAGGRVGKQIMGSDKFKGWASSNNKFARLAGDKILTGGKNMYEGTWDARNSKTLSTAYGMANKTTGANINVGKGGTKTAKANNRDIAAMAAAAKSRVSFNNEHKINAFSTLSSDGKKVEATRAMAGVDSYNNVDAKVKEAKDRIGKNINEKEFKDYREKLVAEIRSEYKDDPEKQRALIQELITIEAYNKADFAKTRNELTKAVDTNIVKKGSKDIHEVRANLEAKNKALTSETSKAPHLQDPALITKLKSEIEPLENKSKSFDEAFERTPSAVKEMAVADVVKFKGQFNKAHLAALNEKIIKGEFEEDEKTEISKMVREIRQDPETLKNRRELAQWIESQAMKASSGFDLELTKELSTALKAASPDPDKIKNIIRVLSKREFEKLAIEEIENDIVLNSVNPSFIKDYSRRIYNSSPVGDEQTEKLAKIADRLEDPTHPHHIALHENPRIIDPTARAKELVNRRKTMVSSFRNLTPPKKTP